MYHGMVRIKKALLGLLAEQLLDRYTRLGESAWPA
jgi:hypothetical protein